MTRPYDLTLELRDEDVPILGASADESYKDQAAELTAVLFAEDVPRATDVASLDEHDDERREVRLLRESKILCQHRRCDHYLSDDHWPPREMERNESPRWQQVSIYPPEDLATLLDTIAEAIRTNDTARFMELAESAINELTLSLREERHDSATEQTLRLAMRQD